MKQEPSSQLPKTLLIGDFKLTVDRYENMGRLDILNKVIVGASGTAWVNFSCTTINIYPFHPRGTSLITRKFKIVSFVTDPETQINLKEAQIIKKFARVGENLEIKLPALSKSRKDIIQAKSELLKKLEAEGRRRKGDVLVRFDRVTIKKESGRGNMGRIINGRAYFPTRNPLPKIIRLSVKGFAILIDRLILSPDASEAHVVLELPGDIVSPENCRPAKLDIGTVTISPDCEFYSDNPASFGPWILGDTGILAAGNGYIADFSSSRSPPSKQNSWKGLLLKRGVASGNPLIPENSNTGYLTGKYEFNNAIVTRLGFNGMLVLSMQHEFHPIYPIGYTITIDGGNIKISASSIISGSLGPGVIETPTLSVCNTNSGNPVIVKFSVLQVQSNLNLTGKVIALSGTQVSWGELTHPQEETIAWQCEVLDGYFFLPAGPVPSFSPDKDTGFLDFVFPGSDILMYFQLETLNMAGITFCQFKNLFIFSPDRPPGFSNSIKLLYPHESWMRIGSRGIDGQIKTYVRAQPENLGNTGRSGYVGNKHFQATLSGPNKENEIFFQFATSAVCDSEINGFLSIPQPCGMPELEFQDMETTSTANLVGGNIMLGQAGEELDYWKLKLASTSETGQAGVLSVRTGRILFNAARISEEVHFDNQYPVDSMIPFPLTWGEMLADGSFGELFLNPNTYGQRFDGLPFSSYNFVLSKYILGATDGYFDVCGTVHFNFFGAYYINIRDARSDNPPETWYQNRFVTVPQHGDAGTEETDLHLQGEWNNSMAIFDFPDSSMAYNEQLQEGFIGTGTSELYFVQSDSLETTIEIHRDAIDICLSSATTHDLHYPMLIHTICGIKELYGCLRIEGPLLERMVIGGYMESSSSSGFGILSPKAAAYIETYLTITPTSSVFYASGDMLLSVAASAVDISGMVRLAVDHNRGSAEGEVLGRIDCNTILGGLTGEGQITWCIAPDMQYFQGRLKVAICMWTGGGGLEGGLFIGNNVPRAKAWVLYSGNEHFGIDDDILPATLTGLYGYGQLSFNIQLYIFGGGIELYAGLGAFTESPLSPPVLLDDWSYMDAIGLPYVLGSAGIHVHGEILGGLVSAAAWADLDLRGPLPPYFIGTFGLEGCALWVLCASIDVTAGISPEEGFFIY